MEARQPVVYPGEGSANIKLKFRMIMFRPYEGEILQGKINKSTPEGVGVTLDFFDDIFIPREHFPQDTHYDEEEGVWVWKYDEGVDLYFDIGEEIRFMVLSEEFRERVIEKGDYNVPDEEEETKPLYSVTVTDIMILSRLIFRVS
jgi:DNA-directed RNA polymerase III subunit RPC8